MRPLTATIPAGGSIVVPLDLYLTPQNVHWSATASVTPTPQVGAMSTFDAAGFPTTSTGYVALAAGTAGTSGNYTNTAYSAISFAGAAGTVITLNQSGIR